MKTFLRMFMVAALASPAAFAFGQTSSGQTPSYALAAMTSPRSSVVSGSLPDANTLVKIGLDENQAREVIGIWDQARMAVAPERAQLRLLNASNDQPADATADPSVSTRAKLQADIDGKLLAYKNQIQTLVGNSEFSRISVFLGHRQMVSVGTWGAEKALGTSS
jgi:hypothetical protein